MTDDKIHYCNDFVDYTIDSDGFRTDAPETGVSQFGGEMYLIKWTDQPYQCCTWEHHEDLVACKYIGKEMLKQLRKQFKNAAKPIVKIMVDPECCQYGQRKAYKPFTSEKPDFLVDVNAKLQPHQIRGVNCLLSNWSKNRSMILADPKDSGKTVQAITFMSALTHQQKVSGPYLVVVPVSQTAAWQEALANWFPDAIVVSLLGSKEDRRLIVENELFQEGVHRFHVCLTTPTVALIEEEVLKKFKWRLICVDEA